MLAAIILLPSPWRHTSTFEENWGSLAELQESPHTTNFRFALRINPHLPEAAENRNEMSALRKNGAGR